MSLEKLQSIVSCIYERTNISKVDIGIVCGSGLSGLATKIQNPISIPYSEIKGFPHSAVAGHMNEIVLGTIGDKTVIALRGRFHFYEGWHPKDVVIGIMLIAALGAKAVVVTNAAGGVNPDFKIGDLMLIEDHISMVSLAGNSSLVGANDEAVGPRFPSISSVYDAGFGKVLEEVHAEIAERMNHTHELRRGCYVGVAGPNYESRHEIEFMRTIGGSSVGMSTVMEVLQAAHCGIKVLGISLITNNCLGTRPEEYNYPEPNHLEVVAETKKVEGFAQAVVEEFITRVDLTGYSSAPMAARFTREKLAEITPAEEEHEQQQDVKKDEVRHCPITGAVCTTPSCPITSMMSYVLTGVVSSLVTLGAIAFMNRRK